VARALIERTIRAVPGPDAAAAAAARAALDAKAKPPGSLGRLEDLACRLAAIRGTADPGRLAPVVVVCAADHGIAEEGVSAYPQEVTRQMLLAFAEGQAAICVLAREAGAKLVVADLGVRGAVEHPAVLDRRIRAGTANAAHGPAMTREEAERAIAAGIGLADIVVAPPDDHVVVPPSDHVVALPDDHVVAPPSDRVVARPDDLAARGRPAAIVALGDMGIANTTSASALTACLLERDPAAVCGRGTGIDDAGLERKVGAIRRALEVNRPSPDDPLGALAAIGGLEIGALAGLVLGCAARRMPVLVDGFITAAAALVAVRLQPRCAGMLIAAHRSPEPGHGAILDALGVDPLLDLGLRLGEGSGAALALPLVAAALAVLSDMATLEAVLGA
jgi:nicotinate-nucleotide--dimethylbenzimidazole phosphoribosyltransferase